MITDKESKELRTESNAKDFLKHVEKMMLFDLRKAYELDPELCNILEEILSGFR